MRVTTNQATESLHNLTNFFRVNEEALNEYRKINGADFHKDIYNIEMMLRGKSREGNVILL